MLISEAFKEYEESEIIAAGLSKKTLESYVYAEKLAEKYFGDIEINIINAQDVREFYAHLLGWQKPDTARGNIVCLRAVVRLVERCEPMAVKADQIKVPKREKRVITYLTDIEVREFIGVVSTRRRGYAEVNRLRNIAICEMLYATGLRVGELCALNKNSIKGGQFAVIGKSKEPRVCFINSRAKTALEAYLAARKDNNMAMFISNETGKRITSGTIRKVFQSACDRSEFEGVHPHTLRHSFATRLLEKEVDLIYIAELMGHESLDTTRAYTHFVNPQLKRIYQRAMEEPVENY